MVEADRQFQPGNFQRIIPLPEAARQELCNICAKLPHRLVMRELINIYFVEANWYFAILEGTLLYWNNIILRNFTTLGVLSTIRQQNMVRLLMYHRIFCISRH